MADPTPMEAFLTQLTAIVTQIITWVTSVITLIVGQPFLLFTVGFLAIGGAIGILGRLLSRR